MFRSAGVLLPWGVVLSMVLTGAASAQERRYKPRPIPAGAEAFTWQAYQAQRLAWRSRTLLEAWRQAGHKDPRWDADVQAFLGRYAEFVEGGHQNPSSIVDLGRAVQSIIEKGCEDPYITYISGQFLQLDGRLPDAAKRIAKSVPALEASGYPRFFAYFALRRLAEVSEKQEDKQTAAGLQPLVRRMLARAAADGIVKDGGQRYYMEQVTALWKQNPGVPVWGEDFLAELDKNKETDTWIRLINEGIYRVRTAWRARGTQWANEVPEQAWDSFFAELEKARAALGHAHKLHPDYPEAASWMIMVAMGTEGWPETRAWFDRAVAAQLDYMEAYQDFLWSIRPRWDGSYARMLSFGRECAATRRFDTGVPDVVWQVLDGITTDEESWRKACRVPGVYRMFAEFFAAALEAPEWQSRQDWVRSLQAVIFWACGKYAESAAVLRELGEKFDERAARRYNVNKGDLLHDLAPHLKQEEGRP